jgi:glycosyltransferase involved in cell wall biosynthesis
MEAGGAQKALLDLAQGLRSMGHQISVWTLYDKEDYIPQFEEHYELQIVDLRMKIPDGKPHQQIMPFLRGILTAYRLMRGGKFHVLQSFQHYSNIIISPIAWLAGIPVRITSQRTPVYNASRWLTFLHRLVNNSSLVDVITAVSEATRRFSIINEKIKPAKIITIYNGVDVHRFMPTEAAEKRLRTRFDLGIEDTHRLITTIGRLAPEKGHQFLIKAISAIRNFCPDARFIFIGEGPLESQLKIQVQRANLENTVTFLGVRKDIPDILLASDLFVLPSLWEGLPNVILEAMAANLPIVGTSSDGTAELVIDGQTGLLVPPGDSGALAEAVSFLLENPQQARAMADAGRMRAIETFSHERNFKAYAELYQRLVSEKVCKK